MLLPFSCQLQRALLGWAVSFALKIDQMVFKAKVAILERKAIQRRMRRFAALDSLSNDGMMMISNNNGVPNLSLQR